MKKAIKLNLITLGLINTIGMTITQAQAEETLGQIDVVEKVISNDKNLSLKPKPKVHVKMSLRKHKPLTKSFGAFLGHLLNKIKARVSFL